MVFGTGGTLADDTPHRRAVPEAIDELLPEAFKHEVELPREELLEVVRRASVMAHAQLAAAACASRRAS